MVAARWPTFEQYSFAPFSFVLFSLFSTATQAAQVVEFYPTGSVKQVQQATVRFSSDMVAMGDPRAKTDPFMITCNLTMKKQSTHSQQAATPHVTPKYTTRWADNKSWVLDFEKPLRAGVRCTFTLNHEAKDLSGAKLEGLEEYSFSTAGPALLGVAPVYGDIEPDQYFVALIDGAIDPKSVEAKSYFEVEGMPDKVGVKVIEGKDREVVIKASIKNNWSWNSYKNLLDQKPLKLFSQIKEMENFIVLAGTRRFPEEAKVVLHWPKGILSKTGIPVEEAQSFNFKVIVPFQALFSCERSVPDRPCNPILDMRVNFTKHMPLKSLKGAKLVSTDGKIWIPTELSKGDQNKNVDGTMVTTPKTGVGVKLISNFEDEQVDSLTQSLQKLPIEIDNPQPEHKLYLNGHILNNAQETTLWPLQRGKYRVELKTASGQSVDAVKFEVR